MAYIKSSSLGRYVYVLFLIDWNCQTHRNSKQRSFLRAKLWYPIQIYFIITKVVLLFIYTSEGMKGATLEFWDPLPLGEYLGTLQ